MSYISLLKELVRNSHNIVFFGGAGVSTESGIPDFRSEDGLYNLKYKHPPEQILSHSFFLKRPNEFYSFYRDKILISGVRPNFAHIKLAELEKCHKLKAVITQNIDGLHQLAGSQNVLELHGSIYRNFCVRCNKFYEAESIGKIGVPICKCGGMIKPDVVLYEEPLDNDVIFESVKAISNADVLIVGGTSLNVYPAAGLIDHYKGSKLVLINKTKLACEERAFLVIHDSIARVFEQI